MGLKLIDVTNVSQKLNVRPEIYVKIVTSFSATLEERLKSLDEAFPGRDIEQMCKILHEIRGTAGNLRLEKIANSAIILHTAVKAKKSSEKLAEYLAPLKIESENLKQSIDDLSTTG